MKDEHKDKDQLIHELRELRQQQIDSESLREELQKQKEILQTIFDHIPVMICFSDQTGQIVMANQEAERVLGWPLEELMSINLLEVCYPDPDYRQQVLNFMVAAESSWTDFKTTIRSGEIVETSWANVRLSDGMSIGIGQDITERKQAEAELRESEETFKAIVEYVPTMINSFDENGQPTIWNKALVESCGYTFEDACELDVLEESYSDKQTIEQVHADLMEKSGVFKEYRPKAKDGKPLVHEWATFGLPDGRAVAVGRDVTERTQLESQLRQAQKMEALGTLAGGNAHEFNNMLLPMLGQTEMLMMRLPEDGKERHHLEEIQTAGKRAAELVRQIMTFSRMDTSTLRPLNMTDVIQEALDLARSTIPANIEIHPLLQEGCDPVMADATLIHQIVLNLCNNAFHAMEEKGGVLEVGLQQLEECPALSGGVGGPPQRGCLRLTVKDTGLGISPEDQEQVFDPFFTTKEVGKGTGLGLSVVHGIVEKHQGQITVESTVGSGTTFSILFPVPRTATRKERAGKEKHRSAPADRRETGHILLVEDERSIVSLYREYLEESGYKITVCGNGKDAVALFRRNPSQYDLVLTDQAMPHKTGKQLSRELLKINSNLPIILSTGYSSVITEEEAMAVGIRFYFEKPIELEELDQMIQECLK